MRAYWLLLIGVAITPLAVLPPILDAQVTGVDAEEVLKRTVEYVLGQTPQGKYSNPVIVSARINEELAANIGIVPTDLTEIVSTLTEIPVWDGEKFCDTSMDPPHWRMNNADFRVSPTLTYISGDTARVSVALSGSSSLKGTTVRTLELVRRDEGWTAVGYVGATMHGASTPCQPLGGRTALNTRLAPSRPAAAPE